MKSVGAFICFAGLVSPQTTLFRSNGINSSFNSFVVDSVYDSINFFESFHFETIEDPTHGFTEFIDLEQAKSLNLVSSIDGKVFIGTDFSEHLKSSGRGRKSIRLKSKAVIKPNSLIILDVEHLPSTAGIAAPRGCSVWPAFWTVGPNWPNDGEIDIIEYINTDSKVLTALHTNRGCKQDILNGFKGNVLTGSWVVSFYYIIAIYVVCISIFVISSAVFYFKLTSRQSAFGLEKFGNGVIPTVFGVVLFVAVTLLAAICVSLLVPIRRIASSCDVNPQGCGILGAKGTVGAAFNDAHPQGAVFALEWQEDKFIRSFFFPRKDIPEDLLQKRPQPSTWGPPYASFALGPACTADHFVDHRIVFDTTFCGDWAGVAFLTDCTPDTLLTCEAFVANNPEEYREAYWLINFLAVYSYVRDPPPLFSTSPPAD